MGLGYQRQDRRAIDYNLWFLPDCVQALRGPRSYWGGDYITFLGAAQTFGRFVERPYAAVVASHLNCEFLNLGFAGAGPLFFVNNKPLLNYINRSKLCFLQVMSGRSVSTALLRAVRGGGMVEFMSGPAQGRSMLADAAYGVVLKDYGLDVLMEQVEHARRQWVEDYQLLFDKIKVPVVLVWVSSRGPDYKYSTKSVAGIFGAFPQMINQETLDQITGRASLVVDATYERYASQFVFNKVTGLPEAVYDEQRFPDRAFHTRYLNGYYPDPGMHEYTAMAIASQLAGTGLLDAKPAPVLDGIL